MKRLVSMGFAVAAVAVLGVAAQGQTPPAGGRTPQPGSSPASRAGGQEMTISGCVERDGAAFKLTDAEAGAAAGAAATSAAADVEDEYTLVAGSGVNLAPHVNHKVEVTGRAAAASGASSSASPAAPRPGSSTPGSSTSPGSSTTPGSRPSPSGSAASAASDDAPSFSVTAVKMVAASCD